MASRSYNLGHAYPAYSDVVNYCGRSTHRGGFRLTNFAVSNSDKTSRLPAALQQPIEQLKNQASQTADQAAAQAQSTDSQTRETQARDVGEKAAKGGAVGTGAAAFAMILGAIAAALG